VGGRLKFVTKHFSSLFVLMQINLTSRVLYLCIMVFLFRNPNATEKDYVLSKEVMKQFLIETLTVTAIGAIGATTIAAAAVIAAAAMMMKKRRKMTMMKNKKRMMMMKKKTMMKKRIMMMKKKRRKMMMKRRKILTFLNRGLLL
jgi:hypothetical protein